MSALKRIRQSEKRRLINKSNKSAMKTYIKKYMKALETGADNTEALLKQAVSVITKLHVKVQSIKKQASRKVSRLTMKFKQSTSS